MSTIGRHDQSCNAYRDEIDDMENAVEPTGGNAIVDKLVQYVVGAAWEEIVEKLGIRSRRRHARIEARATLSKIIA